MVGLQLLNPVLRSTDATADDAQWWGFFNFKQAGKFRIGKMLINWASGQPTVRILTATMPTYRFATMPSGEISRVPFSLTIDANVKSLLHDAATGKFQLWGQYKNVPYSTDNSLVSCDTITVATCTGLGPSGDPIFCDDQRQGCKVHDGCIPAGESANVYEANTGVAGSTLAYWEVTRFSFSNRRLVSSLSRPMPTGYAVGRHFPFRWNAADGIRFLFSATNDDHICSRFMFNFFARLYIVKSVVTPQP